MANEPYYQQLHTADSEETTSASTNPYIPTTPAPGPTVPQSPTNISPAYIYNWDPDRQQWVKIRNPNFEGPGGEGGSGGGF